MRIAVAAPLSAGTPSGSSGRSTSRTERQLAEVTKLVAAALGEERAGQLAAAIAKNLAAIRAALRRHVHEEFERQNWRLPRGFPRPQPLEKPFASLTEEEILEAPRRGHAPRPEAPHAGVAPATTAPARSPRRPAHRPPLASDGRHPLQADREAATQGPPAARHPARRVRQRPARLAVHARPRLHDPGALRARALLRVRRRHRRDDRAVLDVRHRSGGPARVRRRGDLGALELELRERSSSSRRATSTR